MKRSNCFGKYISCNAGFSFIEIAVALIIIGMLSGAGLLLLGKTLESTQRKETVQRLLEAKSALLLFAENQGKLPVEAGYYQKTGSSPVDAWQNIVTYKASPNIDIYIPNPYDVCRRTKNPNVAYTGWTPGATAASSWIKLDEQIKGTNYTANGTGGKAVVALLLSGGARDADGAGNFFDGGNANGTPNYVRKYPAGDFDDIVVAITAEELYGAIKENFCMATVTVTDARDPLLGGGLYYVRDNTTNTDIGTANLNQTVTVRVPFDEKLIIRDAANGGGTILKAETTITANPTPLTFP